MAKFNAGESGNKNGRPKGSGRNAECVAWAGAYGIPFLIRIAEGKEKEADARGKLRKLSLSKRMDATIFLIDQGIGRASQRHEVSGDERPVRFVFGPGSEDSPSD